MVLFDHITNQLNNIGIEDITINEANQILRRFKIRLKSLPGYGNAGLKGKEILELAEQDNKSCIDLIG